MNKYYIGDYDHIPQEGQYDEVTELDNNRDLDFINASGLSFQTRISNLTGENIIVKDRFGIEYVIEPTNINLRRFSEREVQVYETIGYAHYTYINIDHISPPKDKVPFTCVSQVHRENISTINQKRADTNFRRTHTGYDSSGVKCVIKYESLKRGIYVPSIDKVMYLANNKKSMHHPESIKGRLIRKKAMTGQHEHFAFNITIHDKHSSIDCRYINVNGQIHKIPVIRDGRYDDGISVDYLGEGDSYTSSRYSLMEGTEVLRLYGSREEAEKYGDLKSEIEAKRAADLLEAQKEVEVLKLRLERFKFETQEQAAKIKHMEQMYESEKMHKDHERYREKNANERDKYAYDREKADMDHENYKEKSDMDKRNQRRKNFYEVLKIIPAIISASITIFVLFKKK